MFGWRKKYVELKLQTERSADYKRAEENYLLGENQTYWVEVIFRGNTITTRYDLMNKVMNVYAGPNVTLQEIYSCTKEQWKEIWALCKYDFPLWADFKYGWNEFNSKGVEDSDKYIEVGTQSGWTMHRHPGIL